MGTVQWDTFGRGREMRQDRNGLDLKDEKKQLHGVKR